MSRPGNRKGYGGGHAEFQSNPPEIALKPLLAKDFVKKKMWRKGPLEENPQDAAMRQLSARYKISMNLFKGFEQGP
jgi:hypothetical protein